MKSISIALTCCVVALLTPLFAPVHAAEQTPTTRPSVEEENQALRSALASQEKELNQLRAELRAKESELTKLKLRQQIVTGTPMTPAPPLSLRPANPMPPGSVPQQFNGSTFYLVPLAELGLAGTIRLNAVEVPASAPATFEPRPIGTIDDRTPAVRELIHGR